MADNTLNTQRMMEYDARSKSALVTYLLWFFLGFLGAHRMYAERVGSGVFQLIIHGLGWLTTAILIGWVFLAVWGVWWVIDAFLIPGWIRSHNLAIARRLGV